MTRPSLALSLVLLAQAAVALYFTRDAWFGADGLHFFAERSNLPGSSEGLFEPYAAHWVTLLDVTWRMLFELVGLRHFLPFVLLAVGSHLLVCWASYLLLVRVGQGPWVAALCVTLLATAGTASEGYLFYAAVALTVPVGLGLLAVLLLEPPEGRSSRPVPASVLLVLGLMWSTVGLVAVVLVGSYVLGRRGLREALSVVAAPLVAFVIWYAATGHEAERIKASGAQLLLLPQFVYTLLAAPFNDLVPVAGAGPGMLMLVLLGMVTARSARAPARVLAWSGVLAAVANAVLVSVANLHLNLDLATRGRYQYVVLALLLPALCLAFSSAAAVVAPLLGPGGVVRAGLVAVLLAMVVLQGLRGQYGHSQFLTAESERYRTLLRGTIAAVALDERMLTPEFPGSLLQAKDFVALAQPEARSSLPDWTTTPQERLDAESMFFVGVESESLNLGGPATMTSDSFTRPLSRTVGCRTYEATSATPSFRLTSFVGAQVSVTSDSPRVGTRLVRDGETSATRTWEVEPGTPLFIGTTAQVAELEVSFDAGGDFEVCRV